MPTGIRLLVAGNGGLTIDAPQDTLTPDLLGRLKAHKAELLALLRPTPEVVKAQAEGKRRQAKAGQACLPVWCQQFGVTCRFMVGNPSGGTVADVGDSSIFQFGMERLLYKMKLTDRIPPWPRKQSKLLSDQLRQAIDDSGLTRYRISKETGISETALALFYNGQRGLSMKAMNALGKFLELEIILGRKPEREREVTYGEHCKRSGRTTANPVRQPRRQRKRRFGWARFPNGQPKVSSTASSNCLKRSYSIGRWKRTWPNG